MITIRFRGEKEMYRTTAALEDHVEAGSEKFAKEGAETLAAYIQAHWSASSPSPVGAAPAVETGNLDSSIIVRSGSRSVRSGRFASKNSVWSVTADTQDGSVQGKTKYNYAQALEDTSYHNRPFFIPAVEAVAVELPEIARKNIVIKGGAWRR